MDNLLTQAQQLKDKSIQHRRYLHQHPETSLNEKHTAEYCQNILKDLGFNIKKSWGYGFTADLLINPNYKTIALRADMDALPIQEKNKHHFVSKNKGAAHMCGHDVHMAIALTAAELLIKNKEQLKNNIRFLFQPSEEKPPGGAPGMIAQGCLEGVDEVYGLHNDPGTQVEHIRTRVGPLLAAADAFYLTIVGRGGHAARPQDCLDPIIVASQLIVNWQSIVARRINPARPAVLSVTQFHGGETFNVIPDAVNLAGTVRTYAKEDRELIVNLMQDSLEPLRKAGYQCDFKYEQGYDSVINHASGVERIMQAARKVLPIENIDITTEPEGWAEDFAYYLQHCSGAFYFLGSGNIEKGITAPLHSAYFDVDEEAILIGAAIMVQIVFC